MEPSSTQRAVIFRADDGREVTFGLLYDALAHLGASSWDALERNYIVRRMAEALQVELVDA